MKAGVMDVVQLPSKNSVNRAGRLLSNELITEAEFKASLDVMNRWRLFHQYPINTFQATLRKRADSIDSTALFGQRLKRTPSIIAKLKRFEGMNLARMQDVAGVRAVVSKIAQVREVQSLYQESGRIEHELVTVDDYILAPKLDGYRSVHLVFRYKNVTNPKFDGMNVELQLRTKLQHAWATAVETLGTFLGQSLKSREGESHWLRFFELTSSAFAHIEGCPKVPSFSSLSFEDTCLAVRQAELQLRVVDKLGAFSVAVDLISGRESKVKKYFYHVVILDSLQRVVRVLPFAEREFEQAVAEYNAQERLALSGAMTDVYLVSAGPLNSLKKAYPNFFLDTGLFIRQVRKLIDVGDALRAQGNRKRFRIPRGQAYFDF